MIPFTIEKRDGRDVRVNWPIGKANVKLQQIRRECISELRKAECVKARAMGVGGLIRPKNPDDPQSEPTLVPMSITEVDGREVMTVDPIASKIKHTGADLIDLIREKWEPFCAEPQYHDNVIEPAIYQKKSGKVAKAASAITESPTTETPKRKRGRPRNDERL